MALLMEEINTATVRERERERERLSIFVSFIPWEANKE